MQLSRDALFRLLEILRQVRRQGERLEPSARWRAELLAEIARQPRPARGRRGLALAVALAAAVLALLALGWWRWGGT